MTKEEKKKERDELTSRHAKLKSDLATEQRFLESNKLRKDISRIEQHLARYHAPEE